MDDYLIIPALAAVDSSTYEHGVAINVYALPDDDRCVEVPPPVLVASYVLPPNIHRVSLDSGIQQAGRQMPPRSLLSLDLGARHFYIPTSSLIPESIRSVGRHSATRVDPVPWEAWGPTSLHPTSEECEHLRFVATAGLHIIYEQTILDFNQYDAAHNIYGPDESAQGVSMSVVRKGPALVAATPTWHDAAREISRGPWERVRIHADGPSYRQTMCSFEYIAGEVGRWYFIEEEDGPKVSSRPVRPRKVDTALTKTLQLVRVVWSEDSIPLTLQFWTF